MSGLSTAAKPTGTLSICILAGGLSTRMGRDKARLRLGRFTVLGRIRAAARASGLPVRVVRRDLVPRCGPLGGIYTGLKRAHGGAVLFLSCDMPFVSEGLLRWVLRASASGKRSIFLHENELAGFPLVLRAADLTVVQQQLEGKQFSLQKLSTALRAKVARCPKQFAGELLNVNTPQEWAEAQRRWKAGR